MKRLLTIMSLVLFFFVGVQEINAQQLQRDQDRPEAVAKQQVVDLTSTLDLNEDQQRALFRILVKNETSKRSGEAFDLEGQMKRVLKPEQYQKWLSSKDN